MADGDIGCVYVKIFLLRGRWEILTDHIFGLGDDGGDFMVLESEPVDDGFFLAEFLVLPVVLEAGFGHEGMNDFMAEQAADILIDIAVHIWVIGVG